MQFDKILSLRWDKFTSHVAGSLDSCYEKQQFVDVSLVCKDGTILKCHRIILANASNFFSRLLSANDHPHPMIILHDIDTDDLKTIINFIYCGEIQVTESDVGRILKIASLLQITGLTDIHIPDENQIANNSATAQNLGKSLPFHPIPFSPEASKNCAQGKMDFIHKPRENVRFSPDSGKNYVDRPGTSKSLHQAPFARQKRKDLEDAVLDWGHVLKTLCGNEQIPLKKLWRDEIEITATKTENSSRAFERNKIISDPSESFEVIVLDDDL